jgi:hypothetical protein
MPCPALAANPLSFEEKFAGLFVAPTFTYALFTFAFGTIFPYPKLDASDIYYTHKNFRSGTAN